MPSPADIWFRAAGAPGPDWGQAAKACLDRLGPVAGANLGFLYVSGALAGQATSVVTLLRGVTGIRDWVGTVGAGVCAGQEEFFDRPAVAVMAARLPQEAFRLFRAPAGQLDELRRETAGWLKERGPALGIVHGDPRTPRLPDLVGDLARSTGAFLVGGLSSGGYSQFTRGPGAAAVAEGGLSGVLLGADVAVATGLSQGCSPIGPVRTVTAAEGNVLVEIDGRRALDVFKEDIGELLARDLRRVAGYVFAALPVEGSDTGDYLVRAIAGIDIENGLLAIADAVVPGQRLLFTRRDHAGAVADLQRMLERLKRRLPRPPRAGLYVSCLGRGPNLFGPDSDELRLIGRELGELPLVGFFANGEICNDRLYGYTGVLTLFL